MRNPVGWTVFATLAASPVLGGNLDLTITGVPADLQSSVRAHLPADLYLDREVSEARIVSLLAGSDAQLREALEPFGFYDARVTHRLEHDGPRFQVRFEVSLGAPTVVTESHVSVSPDAAAIPAIARAINSFAPKPGSPLNHAQYENSKAAVMAALTNSGYLAARIRDHRVEVVSASHRASIRLSWDCGIRYRFGAVSFPATDLSAALLARMVPWKAGDYYSAEKLLELQRRLNAAEYFDSATVQPRMDQAGAGTVPVDVRLKPARRNVYRASVYASTDTGAGVKLALERRWVNGSGHKLQTDVDYAQRLQAASLSYRIPFAGADERAITFATTFRDETTDSTHERTGKFALNETQQWHGLTRTLGLQMIGGDFEVGSEHGRSNELYALGALTYTHADDPAFPHNGASVTAEAKFAPADFVSRTRFAAIDLRAKWITPSGDRARIILRGELGAMVVDHFDDLPPDLRFFAGGDRSIRGFNYEAIGSRNETGDVVGGTFLTVVSGEYERYFGRKWGAAAFVDAGDAFLRNKFTWNVGAGIGLRWKSPVGVVRFDIGIPLVTELEKSVRIHLTMGPDL